MRSRSSPTRREPRTAGAAGVPLLVLDRPRDVLGTLAARVYGDPAQRLTLMAVTGTQGKTTTTRLLEGGLTAAGIPAAVDRHGRHPDRRHRGAARP